ncbi:hypothetical protein MBGDF03_00600 [Thermoplasmatales archaeon SCGC AB-540-F20]|nr:hypothetical protein MBGDF03_00600 [Thermoplasmatales archaeon SCGC AB-540-F20]
MNKKILIGSMLVFTMLLLMPSIPAIQQNLVKNEKIVEILETNLKFPILNGIIYFSLVWRLVRAIALLSVSSNGTDNGGRGPPDFDILHPFLFYRGLWLSMTFNLLMISSMILSDVFELNWILPNIFIG